MLWPKKNSFKEFDNKKKFLRLENSPPPHNFSNGPSLRYQLWPSFSRLIFNENASFLEFEFRLRVYFK